MRRLGGVGAGADAESGNVAVAERGLAKNGVGRADIFDAVGDAENVDSSFGLDVDVIRPVDVVGADCVGIFPAGMPIVDGHLGDQQRLEVGAAGLPNWQDDFAGAIFAEDWGNER